MSHTVNAKICGPQLRGVQVNKSPGSGTGSGMSVSVNDEGVAEVSVGLVPSICVKKPPTCVVSSWIQHTNDDPYDCEFSNKLRWQYTLSFDRVDGIKIFYYDPPDCDWERTFVDSQFYGPILEAYPDGTGGEIIPGKNANPFGQKEKSTAMLVNKLRPGEPIALTWRRTFAGWQHPGGSYFHGYNIVGGKIMAIVVPPTEDAPMYSVNVMGEIGTFPSNDYYPYSVGDWVSVVGMGNADTAIPGNVSITDAFIVPLITW